MQPVNIGLVVGWILTAAGWFYSNYQANKREERKELRSEADKCIEITERIISDLRSYHEPIASGEIQPPLTSKIKYDFQKLMLKAQRLSSRLNSESIQEKCSSLWESATGGSFDTPSFADEAKTKTYMQSVEGSANDFIEELEDMLYKKYYGEKQISSFGAHVEAIAECAKSFIKN